MIRLVLLFFALLFCGAGSAWSQNASGPSNDQSLNILSELTKISRSVVTLNDRLKSFVDKFEKVGSSNMTEKQQDIIFGMELLIKNEQLIATFQKSQIELTEKLNETRAKLAQTEIDLRPRTIDRSLALAGTTETEELRENRRQKLQADKVSFTQLFNQIQENLADTNEKLRNSQLQAAALRRQLLPQIDKEIYKNN